MSSLPVPVDSHADFERFFEQSSAPGPSSLPVSNPTKAFWTHPGLSKDWPRDDDDPEGWKRINPYALEGSQGPLSTSEADVVIIGSGITGVSIALELGRLVREANEGITKDSSSSDLRVVILEARNFCSGATGRNGGHLTAAISHKYSSLAKLYPPEEVRRCFDLEKHTVASILSLIKKHGWAEYVDLVKGGHNVLMFSEKEKREAKGDWKEALEAGVITEDQIQWFTEEETKQKYGASYPMWRSGGHNLWPLKLVTKMFELARDGTSNGRDQIGEFIESSTKEGEEENPSTSTSSGHYLIGGVRKFISGLLPSSRSNQVDQDKNSAAAVSSGGYQLTLHTHTPVHNVSRNEEEGGAAASSSSSSFQWSVHTSRGDIKTNYVVYATNAYTSHLLPHLKGPDGIVPVRGQAIGIRANVGYTDEGWKGEGEKSGLSRSGWSANEGFEYWFPRPHPQIRSSNLHDLPSSSGLEPNGGGDPNNALRRPLIILGGARETMMGRGYGMYETDDSKLDPEASRSLRPFLGHVFPGKFPPGVDSGDPERPTESTSAECNEDDGVEVEWTGIMGFTKNGDPFVGRVKDANGDEVKGQYIVAGFTGHGMPRAYGCAEALASLLWRDMFRPDDSWSPPEWLPRHYLTGTF